MTDWDFRFIELARHISGWSKETGKCVGAVVVGPDRTGQDREIRATGFNGFPRGINDDIPERHDRESGQKHLWSCHAEINAICNAARIGTPLNDCTMYVSCYPCVDCAKAIIQSGIVTLVSPAPDLTDSKWGEQFKLAGVMLAEAGMGVKVL